MVLDFLQEVSSIMAPLTDNLKKVLVRTRVGKEFYSDQREVIHYPVLVLPNFDKLFVVNCDASSLGLGIVLSEKGNSTQEAYQTQQKKVHL
mgnify:CR=1 FL=1